MLKSNLAKRKQSLIAFLLFTFLSFVLFFNKFPLAGENLRSIGNDFNSFFLNWHYMAKKLAVGKIPHWTPYESLGGQPFIGNGFANLYPIHFIGYLLIFLLGIGEGAIFIFLAEIVFHFAIGGFFAYLFFRDGLKINFWPALVGAAVFIFNPIFITFTEAPAQLFSSIWLPAVLYFLTRFFDTRSWSKLYLAGLFFGLSLLGGYFYNSLLIFIFSFAWAAFLVSKKQGSVKER
ncbi:hypothetical protein L6258_00815, partial [Candidatus Parcubacteria bacterium]|nr:hypothetical protein [Candidatus Parcubacteria bacterium]